MIVSWEDYRALCAPGEHPTTKQALRLRDELIATYMPLAKKVASHSHSKMPSHVDKGGIESLAFEGLMESVVKFNHTLSVPFEAFATQTMKRRILDGVRKLDWAPRSLRQNMRLIEKASEQLKLGLQREPTTAEIAEYLDLDISTVLETKYQSDNATHAYIEDSVEAVNSFSTQRVEEVELAKHIREVTTNAVDSLPFKQKLVLCLHYYFDKSILDIAKMMGISEAKAGTLHTDGVRNVWAELSATITR
jgi:RNA polymerase sigma factor for flagellar operon FliA